MAEGSGGTGGATELDRVVATLEALRPEEFVAARDELVRRLRAQGDRATAGRIARLRRPTMSVWVANELARERPELVERLVALGEELEGAQEAVTSGEASAARQLQQLLLRERQELDGAVQAGRTLLLGAGYQASGPALERLRASLHAAAVTAAGREALAGGRITQDLQVSGLDAGADLLGAQAAPAQPQPEAPPAPPATAAPPGTAAPPETGAPAETAGQPEAAAPSEAAAREAAEEALAAARAVEERAAANAQRAQRLAESAAEAAGAADAHARMLREIAGDLAEAAAALTRHAQAAEQAADQATTQAGALTEAASHAAEQVRAAEENLERAREIHRRAAEKVQQE